LYAEAGSISPVPTSRRAGALLLLAAFLGGGTPVEAAGPPAREVRAVWVTTAAGLDWPRTRTAADQQSSLRAIVRTLRDANFTTIYFQVRARGDAYYRSTLEPWAENLSGTLGRDPGWDPLDFLLREAHDAGLEVHAWFNVFKVNGPGRPGPSSPPHPSRIFPQWSITYENEGWLDPGAPEVRAYLQSVAVDLVRRYPVDGLHFDFIRYPGADFPDAATYRRFGNGRPKAEWRRANVTEFVRSTGAAVRAVRPDLQVGSAPLGVYVAPNGGWGGFATYFQESRRWLAEGLQDYLAPQIYWDTGSTPGNPDFEALAAEWQGAAAGRHVVAGIGAYKEEVRREIPLQIDIARRLGMAGQAFFRYEYVADPAVLGGRYDLPALPPSRPWRDSLPPAPPAMLAVTESGPGIFSLEWSRSGPAADGDTAGRYAVYRRTPGGAPLLVGITPGGVNFFTDSSRAAPDPEVSYAVHAVDKSLNESPPVLGSAAFREVTDLRGRLAARPALAALLGDRRATPGLVAYRLTAPGPALLELQNLDTPETPLVLADRRHDAGTYVVGLSPLRIPPGRYVLRLHTAGGTLEEPLILR
jgi:uncharacterized lipoprotein YddW (UPF0748 family)